MFILSSAMLSIFGLFCFNSGKILKFLFLFTMCACTCLPMLFNYSYFVYSYMTLQTDLLSLSLLFITTLLLVIAPLTQNFNTSTLNSLYLSMLSLGLFSFFMFSTTNFLVLYVSYEASLLPIMYCIFKWGVYPERTLSALMMLLFTSFFTFPLMIILLLTSSFSFSLAPSVCSLSFSLGVSLWVIFSFAVKLPVFGLHYWLPMAHVEAPTFGSMILAGVLLKMGGCGLVRLSPLFFNQLQDVSQLLSSFLMFGVLCSAALCCVQSDFKRLVAYSSVSHMTLIFLLILSPTYIASYSLVLLMVFHGISSPLLFFGVGQTSFILSTREMILFRGVSTINPLFITFLLVTFLLVIPVPPFPAFLGELLVFFSMLQLSPLMPVMVFFALLLGLLYSLLWFSSLQGKIVTVLPTGFTPQAHSLVPFLLCSSAFLVLPLLML